MPSTLIHNATLVNERRVYRGSLLIEGTFIKALYEGDNAIDKAFTQAVSSQTQLLDASHLFLLPGIIDDQVHFRDPGQPQKGTLRQESKAALLGGVTSFMDMPNNVPPTTNQETLHHKYQVAAQEAYANYAFYIGTTNDNALEAVNVSPPCCGIKVFMGSSTGNMLVDNPQALEQLFSQAPGVVATHCEDEDIIKANKERILSSPHLHPSASLHPLIRSREACIASTQKALALAKRFHTKLHVLHITTADEVELLREAQQTYPSITGEVCVHHLWFTQDDYPAYGNLIKCNPAIKLANDREALRQGIRDGVLQVIGSDHAPHTWEEKAQPYPTAPAGIPLVQHSLLMMLELVDKGVFTLEQVVNGMCHGPARVFSLPKRGFLRPGCFADLTLVAHTPYTVTPANTGYTCHWSPFTGHTFPYHVAHVFVNGCQAVSDGTLVSRPPVMAIR